MEPKIPPKAKSANWGSPARKRISAAEVVATNIPGSDVPIETMVSPITTSGRPARKARPLAPSIKKSADLINNYFKDEKLKMLNIEKAIEYTDQHFSPVQFKKNILDIFKTTMISK